MGSLVGMVSCSASSNRSSSFLPGSPIGASAGCSVGIDGVAGPVVAAGVGGSSSRVISGEEFGFVDEDMMRSADG
jgi:hypothetical protein